jgi:hypothetical protein
MGFDLNIHVDLLICSDTGKPYFYISDGSRMRVYDLSKLTVPKEHRRFLNQRGGIFHAYTTNVFENNDITNVSVYEFLEKYPSWTAVKDFDEECNHYWTEKDHNEFKAALEWFNKDCIMYRINWSY